MHGKIIGEIIFDFLKSYLVLCGYPCYDDIKTDERGRVQTWILVGLRPVKLANNGE